MNQNNNPLNVKWASPRDTSVLWRGSTGYDSRGHAIFLTVPSGIRAAIRSMQSKWNNNKRTIKSIIRDWAEKKDTIGSIPGNPQNDPAAYIHYVSDVTGIYDQLILPDPVKNPIPWLKIIHAMARYEMGEDCSWIAIFIGMAQWMDDFGKPLPDETVAHPLVTLRQTGG